MSSETGDHNQSEQRIPRSPDPSNNEEVLNDRLETLSERYSYERLSDLSARRLGAIDVDKDGITEEEYLHNRFQELHKRFPDESADHSLRQLALGDDYEALAPLTIEQKERIYDCHHECSRNLDRARQDALEREDLAGPLSRLASWMIDFADAATPVFGTWR